MRRREFLEHASILAAIGLIPGVWTRTLAEDGGTFRPLADGIGVFTERGGTVAWMVRPDGIAVVDTQFPPSIRHCLEDIRERSSRVIDVVLNTHHHGDHTAGNAVLKDHAKQIVAHANVPGLQKAAAEKRGNLDAQAYADTTFETTWSADVGPETISARHFGPGHTGGDAVVHFENAGIIHMGDLVFHRMVPYIDRPGGASVQGWIEVLETVAKSYPADGTFLFGHASEGNDVVGQRDDLGLMAGYLAGLLEYVEKGRAAGSSLDELAAVDRIPGFPDHAPGWDGAIRNNVEAAWEELAG